MRSILFVLVVAGCATEGTANLPAPSSPLPVGPSAYVGLECPAPGMIKQRYQIFIDGDAVPVVLDARASVNAAWYCGGTIGRIRLRAAALDDRRPRTEPPAPAPPPPRPMVTAMPPAPAAPVATTTFHR